MGTEVLVNSTKNKKRNTIFVLLSVFISLMLFAAITFTYLTLQSDRVYKGVHIGDIDASGMSPRELSEAIDSKYLPETDKLEITLRTDKLERRTTYTQLNIRYDSAAAAQEAYDAGRSGNIFKRLLAIAQAGIKGIYLDVPLSIDENKVDSFINDFYSDTLVTVKEGSLLVTDSNVTIRSGVHGENIDKDKTRKLVESLIEKRKGGVVEPEVIITPPSRFNTDELYDQISSEAENAHYTMENSSLTLVPHKAGRQVDKAELEKIISELENTENTEKVIPITVKTPEITSEKAETLLFRDKLASASSSFGTGTENGKNRKHNMGLAAAKINNMILMPGAEFSFNDVVGPRDIAHGYKMAHVFSAGKIIDGVGGGICQVSSTLYNAVLKADLKVTERRNHSFVVGYVPLGQDATAYYGGVDFKFVNSTNWPMKFTAAVTGNKISVSIQGTNETPGKSVIISNKILKETPYTIKYTDDPTLPVGTTKELQEGLNGYVVETYKTIKVDGKVVSQTKLHTSTYKAYAQEVLKGTKPADGAAVPENPAKTPDPGKTPATDGGEILDEAPAEEAA